MLIFNFTFLVSDKVRDKWLHWVRETHIPEMISSGYFTEPRLAKILSTHEQDGSSYSIQYQIDDKYKLNTWNQRFAKEMEKNCAALFGEEVLLFTTVLEVIS